MTFQPKTLWFRTLLTLGALSLSAGAWADETNYSIGLGLQSASEAVSPASSYSGSKLSNQTLQSLQALGNMTWFQGSKETGGITFAFSPALGLTTSWSSASYSKSSVAVETLSLGYQFFQPWDHGFFLRFGPVLSGSLVLATGENPGNSLQDSYSGAFFGLGAMGQIDWHPFDTGNGGVDGLFLFASANATLDFPGFPTGRLSGLFGFGMTLE